MDAEPTVWDATPRDRAVTRGLLMGLSRRRAEFFAGRIPTTIVTSIFTVGLKPLWIGGERVDRWRRYEWNLLHAFAIWWHARTGDAGLRQLADDADRFASPPDIDRPVVMALLCALVLIGVSLRDG